MRFIFFAFITIITVSSCIAPNSTFEKIPPGIWRGALLLDRTPVAKYGDDRDIVKKFDFDSELPFNFEVVYDNDTSFHIIIHNDSERIKVTDIFFGRDKATAKDTVIINFPIYDSYIKAIYEDGVMEGDWIVNYRENYKIPFKAVHGVSDRFAMVDNGEVLNVDGKWACTFDIGTETEYKAVGIFKQDGKKIVGTFLTETGDYRFLEGIVYKDKLYLSTFDGSHAYMFLGKVLGDGTITGTFRSGSQYTTNWEAKRDEKASLANAYELTKRVGDAPLSFTFPNTAGQQVSINDDKYKGKTKLIQVMGSWCPNCMDETVFLQEYFKKNPMDDVAIISLGFERYEDEKKSTAALKRFADRMKIDHEVLYAGYYDKDVAAQKLPQLDKIISYPTLLFVDKDNKIVKIHTGFSGPATPGYADFEKEFTTTLNSIRQK